MLPCDVMRRAVLQQELENQKTAQALEDAQARLVQSEASAQQMRRVCSKGVARSRVVIKQRKLLQAEFDRLNSERDGKVLKATLQDKEDSFHRSLAEAMAIHHKNERSKVRYRSSTSTPYPAVLINACWSFTLLLYIVRYH